MHNKMTTRLVSSREHLYFSIPLNLSKYSYNVSAYTISILESSLVIFPFTESKKSFTSFLIPATKTSFTSSLSILVFRLSAIFSPISFWAPAPPTAYVMVSFLSFRGIQFSFPKSVLHSFYVSAKIHFQDPDNLIFEQDQFSILLNLYLQVIQLVKENR